MGVNNFDLMAAARRWPAESSGERFTLLTLVSYMGQDEDGRWVAWPGIRTLAVDTLQSERTIKRHLDRFEDVGLVSTRRRTAKEGRGSQPSVIILNVSGLMTKGSLCPDGQTTKVTPEHDQGDTGDTTKVTPGANAPHIEPPVEPLEEQPLLVAEATRLCDLLADLIQANGSKRPVVTKRWTDAAERLMRLDGKTSEQVEACIRWSQRDEFWRANILSMPKLREKYDQLRLAAKRERGASRGRPGTLEQAGGLLFDANDNLVGVRS